jgi:hypothetical protein
MTRHTTAVGAALAVTVLLWPPAPAPAASEAGCRLKVGDFRLLDGGRTLRHRGRVRCRRVRENVLLGLTVFRRVDGRRQLVRLRSRTAEFASRLRIHADVRCRNGRYVVKATFIYGPGLEFSRRRAFRIRGCA